MGAVLVPLLVGLEQAPALPHASSLCGACTDACPVKIPLHELLLDLRSDLVEGGIALARRAARVHALVVRLVARRSGYRLSTALARLGQPLAGLGGPGRVWATGRALPRLAPPLPGPPVTSTTTSPRTPRRPASSSTAARRPRSTGAGVSRAVYGLADTGSVVLAASPDEPRASSLLPDVHVTLLREDRRSCPDLAELFERLGGELPSALAIVTGPSRSGDIEQKLAVGVHGPGEVHVVLEP